MFCQLTAFSETYNGLDTQRLEKNTCRSINKTFNFNLIPSSNEENEHNEGPINFKSVQ